MEYRNEKAHRIGGLVEIEGSKAIVPERRLEGNQPRQRPIAGPMQRTVVDGLDPDHEAGQILQNFPASHRRGMNTAIRSARKSGHPTSQSDPPNGCR